MDKGISDLETCMDYFALPRKRYENLNFCFSALAIRTEKPVSSTKVFLGIRLFSAVSHLRTNGRENSIFSQLLPGSTK